METTGGGGNRIKELAIPGFLLHFNTIHGRIYYRLTAKNRINELPVNDFLFEFDTIYTLNHKNVAFYF